MIGRRLGAGGVEDASWPPWVERWSHLSVLLVAILTALPINRAFHIGPVVLIALAVAPWWWHWLPWQWPRRCGPEMPEPWSSALFYGALAVPLLAGPGLGWYELPMYSQAVLILAVFVTGEKGATLPYPASLWALGASVVLVLVAATVVEGFDSTVIWVVGIGFAYGAGLVMRLLVATITELEETRAALADEAVARERARIAREVHDVVAHSLAATMLHLTAARMAIRRSPGDAEEALAEAERVGRRSLADIRRTVGLLGSDDPAARALPGIDDLDGLVDDLRSGGLDVECSVAVDPALVGEVEGLAAYRVVQEALSNIVKHAPGSPATVQVSTAGDHLSVTVTDEGARRPPPVRSDSGRGHGLEGMAARVTQLGGSLRAGPRSGTRGWEVEVRLPVAVAVEGVEVAET